MPLPFPEGTQAQASDPIQRSLVKIVQLTADLTTALQSGSGGSVSAGAGDPEGSVTGTVANQLYVRTNEAGTRIIGFYLFTGTTGTDTGWITTS